MFTKQQAVFQKVRKIQFLIDMAPTNESNHWNMLNKI